MAFICTHSNQDWRLLSDSEPEETLWMLRVYGVHVMHLYYVVYVAAMYLAQLAVHSRVHSRVYRLHNAQWLRAIYTEGCTWCTVRDEEHDCSETGEWTSLLTADPGVLTNTICGRLFPVRWTHTGCWWWWWWWWWWVVLWWWWCEKSRQKAEEKKKHYWVM